MAISLRYTTSHKRENYARKKTIRTKDTHKKENKWVNNFVITKSESS